MMKKQKQYYGKIGIDKRIDVLSTVIFAKLKISDLSQLDLAYTSPFSPAKYPIVVTEFVGENIESENCNQLNIGDFKII